MRDILRTITPKTSEVVLYLLLAIGLLLLFNVGGFIDWLFNSTGTDQDTASSIDETVRTFISEKTSLLNTQLGNSLIWSIMGAVAFFTAFGIATSYRGVKQDESLLNEIGDAQARQAEAHELKVRTRIRFAALFGVLLWLILFFSVITKLADTFFDNIQNLLTVGTAFFAIVLSILATAMLLYALAILIRLIALRVRIFSDEI